MMPDMVSINQWEDNPMPCLKSFANAMSGVKKMTNFVAAITCPSLAFEPSYIERSIYTYTYHGCTIKDL